MFETAPTARADLKAGTVYAVTGENSWIYYAQVTSSRDLAFFRLRSRDLEAVDAPLSRPVMSTITVAVPSITRALRAGAWKHLGRHELAEEASAPTLHVQWPVGTLTVTVWQDGTPAFDTRADDPAIQAIELMAVWDAEAHIPQRLTADFGEEEAAWHVGGPIRRERLIREERARRWPDQPAHRLPPDWVSTSVR
jgi:hypothetical protein